MSVTVHTVYLCSVTVLQCKWPSGPFAFIKYIRRQSTITHSGVIKGERGQLPPGAESDWAQNIFTENILLLTTTKML